MAVAFSALRTVLHHDDDALSAVVHVAFGDEISVFAEWVLQHDDPNVRGCLGTMLGNCALYLAFEGPTVCPQLPYQAPPILIAPVIKHLYPVVQELLGEEEARGLLWPAGVGFR